MAIKQSEDDLNTPDKFTKINLRLPNFLLERILKQAKIEGIQNTSEWVRMAIQYTLENKGKDNGGISKESLLNLIENDADISFAIYRSIARTTGLRSIMKQLSEIQQDDISRSAIKDQSNNIPVCNQTSLNYVCDFFQYLPDPETNAGVFTSRKHTLAAVVWEPNEYVLPSIEYTKFKKYNRDDKNSIYDVFCMVDYNAPSEKIIGFWGGRDRINIDELVSKYDKVEKKRIRIYHGLMLFYMVCSNFVMNERKSYIKMREVCMEMIKKSISNVTINSDSASIENSLVHNVDASIAWACPEIKIRMTGKKFKGIPDIILGKWFTYQRLRGDDSRDFTNGINEDERIGEIPKLFISYNNEEKTSSRYDENGFYDYAGDYYNVAISWINASKTTMTLYEKYAKLFGVRRVESWSELFGDPERAKAFEEGLAAIQAKIFKNKDI